VITLAGGRVALGPDCAAPRDLEFPGPRLHLDLRGYLILPGLINAHDHLEFNLYPRLGRGPYPNAGVWARDVYRPDEAPIREVRKISKSTRLMWGGLKNLLCGVTTVCHHNPMDFAIFDRNFPVRVVRRFGWAHSIEYSPDLAERFRQTPAGEPFVVHLAEGTDEQARDEIFRLDEMGALDCRTVLVHAVGLDAAGLELARRKGASLIWCPSSNLFLLGRTLGADVLRSGIPVALGSDSGLTADGDLLDEMQAAHRCGMAPDEIYRMVTEAPARMLQLRLEGDGDLIAISDQGLSPAETLLAGRGPELAIVKGRIRLISPELATRAGGSWLRFTRIRIDGRDEVLLDAGVPGIYRRATRVLGEVRLAGRRVSAGR
jgi:cytosine/adenosine deaminase-related metal-dependent hydrolase